MSNATLDYLKQARAILERIEASQIDAIERAAGFCAAAIAGDGTRHRETSAARAVHQRRSGPAAEGVGLLRGAPALPAWVEGVLWGALPLVHLHTFAFVSVLLATWALGTGRVRAALPGLLWAVVPATWGVLEVTDFLRAGSLVGWKPGWTMGAQNPVAFLLVNFGLFLPLALVALAVSLWEKRREETLVLAPALGVLAALFLVRLAPWEWDNTKVMLWCYVASLPPIGTLVLARVGSVWRGLALVGLLFCAGRTAALSPRAGLGPRLAPDRRGPRAQRRSRGPAPRGSGRVSGGGASRQGARVDPLAS